MWEQNSTLLNNRWIEKKRELENDLETNENGNAVYQKLMDASKSVLRWNFITVNVSFKGEILDNLTSYTSRSQRKNKVSSKLPEWE